MNKAGAQLDGGFLREEGSLKGILLYNENVNNAA